MTTAAKRKVAEIQQTIRDVSLQLHRHQDDLQTQLRIIRQKCKHENIGECRQVAKDYFYSRLCLDCGVWEHDNGAGFHFLTNRHPRKFKTVPDLKKASPYPTATWEWCYGLGGHELPGHPVAAGELKGTRCNICLAATWLVTHERLGRCESCNGRINPSYKFCRQCNPKRRKVRELTLMNAEICPSCNGQLSHYNSYLDGTGEGRWTDCNTCKRAGVVTTVEAIQYKERSR